MNILKCYRKCRANSSPSYCLRYCANRPIPKPTSMRRLIRNATGCEWSDIHIRDAKLDTISWGQAQAFLAQDDTNLQNYIEEKHDCDDFADRLYCAAREYFFKQGVNVAWANIEAPVGGILHRVNGFTLNNLSFVIVEPQTDITYQVAAYLTGPPNFVNM